MTISLSETVNEGLQARFPFPLYILLGRLVAGTTVSEVGMHKLIVILMCTHKALLFIY